MNLFDINQKIKELQLEIDPETGEIPDEAATALDNMEMSKFDKVRSLSLLEKELDYEIQCLDSECHKLSDRIVKDKKKREWIKNYLLAALDGENIKGTDFEVKHSKSYTTETTKDFLDWAKDGHTEYLNIKPAPEPAPNKSEIAKALKSGIEIPGAWIEQHINLKIN